MKIQIINTSRHPLPQYATPQSAGVDLRANLNEPIVLKPLQRCLVPTGLFLALPQGYEVSGATSTPVIGYQKVLPY